MPGKKKQANREYDKGWGGRRENQTGRPPITDESQRKHSRCFWVTDAEREALAKYLDELRNGKPEE